MDQELERMLKLAGVEPDKLQDEFKKLNGRDRLIGTFILSLASAVGVNQETVAAWRHEYQTTGDQSNFPMTERIAAKIIEQLLKK